MLHGVPIKEEYPEPHPDEEEPGLPRRKNICRPPGGGKAGVLREKAKPRSFVRKRGQGPKGKEEPGPPRRKNNKGFQVGRSIREGRSAGVPKKEEEPDTQRGKRSRVSKEEEPSPTLGREDPEYPMRKRS